VCTQETHACLTLACWIGNQWTRIGSSQQIHTPWTRFIVPVRGGVEVGEGKCDRKVRAHRFSSFPISASSVEGKCSSHRFTAPSHTILIQALLTHTGKRLRDKLEAGQDLPPPVCLVGRIAIDFAPLPHPAVLPSCV